MSGVQLHVPSGFGTHWNVLGTPFTMTNICKQRTPFTLTTARATMESSTLAIIVPQKHKLKVSLRLTSAFTTIVATLQWLASIWTQALPKAVTQRLIKTGHPVMIKFPAWSVLTLQSQPPQAKVNEMNEINSELYNFSKFFTVWEREKWLQTK